jgi:multiple sugar transport system permease protein
MFKAKIGFCSKLLNSGGFLGWLFLSPALMLIGLIIGYPLFLTLYESLFNRNLLKPNAPLKFVGLDNYVWLFTESETFWKAFINSVILTAGTLSLTIIIGILIAVTLNRKIIGRNVLRSITILPYAVPTIVAAIMWEWGFNSVIGWVNKVLLFFGVIDQGLGWLGDPHLAMVGIIIAHVWKQLPFVILVILAGLQSIPQELYEAAKIDGTGPIGEFFHITLPGLRYVIWVIIILRSIWTFNWFEYVYLMTGGGPANSTLTLPITVYKVMFNEFKPSHSSAIATFMMLFLFILIMLFTHIQRKET